MFSMNCMGYAGDWWTSAARPLVHVERDRVGRPHSRVPVRLAGVDGHGLRGELVPDRRVAPRVHAHADARDVGADVAAEDLEDADLGRSLGAVLEADHPERDHVRGVVEGSRPRLEQAVLRRVEGHRRLGFAHDEPIPEPQLPDRAAERTGERTGLERGDPQVPVVLGRPGRLVGIDPQLQPAAAHRVSSRRRRA